MIRRASRASQGSLTLEPGALAQSFTLSVVDVDGLLSRPRARGLVAATLRGGHGPAPVVVPVSQLGPDTPRVDAVTLSRQRLALSPPRSGAPIIDPRAAYVITGGFGGIGLTAARWLAGAGARCLVLVGRKGASTREAQDAVHALSSRGIRVVEVRADVMHLASLAQAFDLEELGVERIGGVVHTASAFDSNMLEHLTEDEIRRHVGPKVHGAWNLHQLTHRMNLDFFLLLSSTAAWIGPQGLGAYAAANGYLDGLAALRRAQGLPALAVNLGGIGDVGVLTVQSHSSRQTAEQGFLPMGIDASLRAIGHLIYGGESRAAVAALDWSALLQKVMRDPTRPRYQYVAAGLELGATPAHATGSARDAIASMDPSERAPFVAIRVRQSVARALGTAPERVQVETSLEDLGLDSLMASQLREDLQNQFEVAVPTMTLLSGPSIQEVARIVLDFCAAGEDSEAVVLMEQVAADDLESALAEIEASEEMDLSGFVVDDESSEEEPFDRSQEEVTVPLPPPPEVSWT
ncbi:MAG: SDR family NAD(P)-dependent oxidoreductase [Myxococcota bacterium]